MKKFYYLFVALFAISSIAAAQVSETRDSNLPFLKSRGIEVSASPFLGSYISYVNNCHGILLDARYKINPILSIGVGSGTFIDEDYYVDQAFYTSARFNFSQNIETVFMDAKLGWLDGGVLIGASVGYDFGRANIAYQFFYDYWNEGVSAITIGFYF